MIIRQNGDVIKMLADAQNTGDAFTVVQGCNCFIAQGGGLAAQLRAFPEVLEADRAYGRHGDVNKLGEYSVAKVNNAEVINAYTQFFPGGSNVKSENYAAIEQVFSKLNEAYKGKTIYTHEIGCGIAGGDLKTVIGIINKVTPDIRIVMLNWTPGVNPREEISFN